MSGLRLKLNHEKNNDHGNSGTFWSVSSAKNGLGKDEMATDRVSNGKW